MGESELSTGAFNAILILFVLAVAGLSELLRERSEARHNAKMEWKAREAFYRDIPMSEATIDYLKQRFFRQRGMKVG